MPKTILLLTCSTTNGDITSAHANIESVNKYIIKYSEEFIGKFDEDKNVLKIKKAIRERDADSIKHLWSEMTGYNEHFSIKELVIHGLNS